MRTGVATVSSGPRLSDAWNSQHRAESPLRRADRNFADLLQELRVLLTSVQILLGFLLTLASNAGFRDLDDWQHAVYVTTLLSAAATSTLLIGPVAAHRLLFQSGCKRDLVQWSQTLSLAALAGLAATLGSGLLLVLDISIGRGFAVATTASLATVIATLWVGVPLMLRRRSRALWIAPSDEADEPSPVDECSAA